MNTNIKKTIKRVYSKFINSQASNTSKVTDTGLKYQVIFNNSTKKKYIKILGVIFGVKKVNIPSEINGLPVEIVAKEAFKGNKLIESVVISRRVRIVGAEAFKDCTSLETIELPVDLEVINKSCFENCTKLNTVIMPYSLKKICKDAFKNCILLEKTPHYMKTGIGAKPVVNRRLIEENLPSGLNEIQEGAFSGCRSIKEVYIPFEVIKIPKDAFKGCVSLKDVSMHSELKTIENEAFACCESLESVKLPPDIEYVDETAFDINCNIKIYNSSSKNIIKQLSKHNVSIIGNTSINIDSKMIPGKANGRFYTNEELALAVETYELRTPVKEVNDNKCKVRDSKASRYSLIDGVYHYTDKTHDNHVKIVMTGDLMCRPKQMKSALRDEEYIFDEEFDWVRGFLSDSDLTIGNMETMVAESFVYSDKTSYVDDRVHLNAPEAFLNSVRKAGFDVVVNSQNHAYDTGTKGVFETLNAQNKQQLMHTGIFASNTDKRYINLEINGINIAIVSYFDQARQAMKRVNYTKEGLDVVYSNFIKTQIKQDIKNAREEGAEFVIAYCHWGKEYTKEITAKQEKFAKMVANAGADYLFGSHSHCVQPYSVILTDDGRKVPVLYSGGNFISDMSIKMPIVRDTLILELCLERDETGKVIIASEEYRPCLIREDENTRGAMVTYPIESLLEKADFNEQLSLEEAALRIKNTIGNQKRLKCSIESVFSPVENETENLSYEEYSVSEPMVPKHVAIPKVKNDYSFDEEKSCYRRERDESLFEARILCAGHIAYDSNVEEDAECFGKYDFAKSFKTVANCFNDIDFAVGGFNAMVSNSHATSSNVIGKKDYYNARTEFIEALKDTGFNCLAMANPYNVCTGVKGIFETQKALKNSGLICSGIGDNKDIIVEINGLKICFLSYTYKCLDKANTITDEGGELFLNEYRKAKVKQAIKRVRSNVDFILVYLNCEEANKETIKKLKAAEEIAELGANYVICTASQEMVQYYKHHTSDGREVPIASSLCNFTYNNGANKDVGALIKLIVRKTFKGDIEIEDNYIPIKLFKECQGIKNAIMPATKYFNDAYAPKDYENAQTRVAKLMGNSIERNRQRIVKMKTHYNPSVTIEEIYKLLNAKPSSKDLAFFGEMYKKKVPCIAFRKPDLMKGCVAGIIDYSASYQKNQISMSIRDIVKSGALLVIDTKDHEELPTIVVKGSVKNAADKLIKYIRDKYNPITVAITGSVGKTTTKDLMHRVFDMNFQTLTIHGNNNTDRTIWQVIQKLSDSDEAYIQEVHGGSKNAAAKCSKLIKPSICVITNIGPAHIKNMGTMENLIKGKMDIVNGLREGGVLIVNNDNEYLRNQKTDVKTIRYSLNDKSCPYYAQNIIESDGEISFQVVSNDSEFDSYGVYDAKLNIQGIHNVSNALGVFAAARQAGIPHHKIVAGLAEYKSEGIRQNLIDIGENRLLIDVYNSNPLSLISTIKAADSIRIDKGCKRIAVIGEMLEQGEKASEIHYETGIEISKNDFDLFLCIGEETKHMVRALRENNKEAYYFSNNELLNMVISQRVMPGDLVLFKASGGLNLNKRTIEPVFGKL